MIGPPEWVYSSHTYADVAAALRPGDNWRLNSKDCRWLGNRDRHPYSPAVPAVAEKPDRRAFVEPILEWERPKVARPSSGTELRLDVRPRHLRQAHGSC